MAWTQKTIFGGESGDATVWVNDQTGQVSYSPPVEASGPVSYTGSYGGEGSGGTDFQYTNAAGSALTDQAAAAGQYTKQLDDAFQQVISNPNASSWEKAMAVQTRYGVEGLAQLVNQGHFQDIAPQLGPHIAARQREGEAEGFSVGGNQLGNWPTIIAMMGAGAYGATAEGAGAGASSAAGGGAAAPAGITYGTAAGDAATIYGTGAATGGGSAGLTGVAGAAGTGAVGLEGAGAGGTSGATGGGAAGATTGALSGGAATTGASLLSNPSVIGAGVGAGLSLLGSNSKQAGTIQTEEGIPDWLMPYVQPALQKYSTELQNYQTDPYGIMPSAMTEFKNTINGMYLDPSTNKYLEDYFKLGAERIKGSLSPTFGHMQAFGQHSGYNEALSRGLGDYAVGLYGGNYAQERDRQTQMTAAAPAFLGQSSQAAFQPYSQYLQSIGSLGRKKEEPYFNNQFGNILGGAMFGSQFGNAFK